MYKVNIFIMFQNWVLELQLLIVESVTTAACLINYYSCMINYYTSMYDQLQQWYVLSVFYSNMYDQLLLLMYD